VVDDLVAKGLARESRGAIGVFLHGDDEPPLLIRKADGAFLYATTDLATIHWRMEHWKPDRILYVVDHRQSQHFEQVFETANRWGIGEVDLEHVAFGTVLGDDGKPFKTRAGDTVGLEALLDEGVSRALGVVTAADAERGTGMPMDERQRIAEAVGIGAIKYADLSQNRTTDYVFSFDKMLQLTGNTAAYMQYAVARVEGIFAKGGIDREQVRRDCHGVQLSDPRERALAMKLLRFAEALEDVEADYRPNVLTAYLFDVAGAYSTFYDALPVLKAEGTERASRLVLCDLTGKVLRKGLELLGIRVPERM
jgi:arginyl-tRNA synthetase